MWHVFNNMFCMEPCTTIYGFYNVMGTSTYIVTKIVCKYDIETAFFQILLGYNQISYQKDAQLYSPEKKKYLVQLIQLSWPLSLKKTILPSFPGFNQSLFVTQHTISLPRSLLI